MPTKHNKKRYQREEKNPPKITLSGRVWLRFHDEEEIDAATKGDLQLFTSVEALNTYRAGEYDTTGYAGYFRVDVYDGRDWQPVQLPPLFPEREHYFSKTERPIDTFTLCKGMLEGLTGQTLTRTYREHYTLHSDDDNISDSE